MQVYFCVPYLDSIPHAPDSNTCSHHHEKNEAEVGVTVYRGIMSFDINGLSRLLNRGNTCVNECISLCVCRDSAEWYGTYEFVTMDLL